MTRHYILLAAGFSTLLLGGLLTYQQIRVDGSADIDAAYIAELDARVDALANLESRLRALEERRDGRAVSPIAPAKAVARTSSSYSDDGDERDDDLTPEIDGGVEPEQVAALQGRLSDLELRARGLEEDPVERGFAALTRPVPIT